jgi:hypothetical protein
MGALHLAVSERPEERVVLIKINPFDSSLSVR